MLQTDSGFNASISVFKDVAGGKKREESKEENGGLTVFVFQWD